MLCDKILGCCDGVAEDLNLPEYDMGFFVLRVKPFKSLECLTLNLKALGQEIPRDMVSHL